MAEVPKVLEQISRWQRRELPDSHECAFAAAARVLRWDEAEAPIEAPRLLEARRSADRGNDTWTTMNRIQEHLIKGGDSYTTPQTHQRRRTSPIRDIGEHTRLNKALMDLDRGTRQALAVRPFDLYSPNPPNTLHRIRQQPAASALMLRAVVYGVCCRGILEAMKMYRFRHTAADAIGDAGLTQAALAARAGYDRKELNKRLNRRGVVRHASASNIAQAFADLARTTKDHAMQMLFEEITEDTANDADQQRNSLVDSDAARKGSA